MSVKSILALRENHKADSETQESGESTIVSFDPELTLPKNTEIGHDDLQKGDILLLSSRRKPLKKKPIHCSLRY